MVARVSLMNSAEQVKLLEESLDKSLNKKSNVTVKTKP